MARTVARRYGFWIGSDRPAFRLAATNDGQPSVRPAMMAMEGYVSVNVSRRRGYKSSTRRQSGSIASAEGALSSVNGAATAMSTVERGTAYEEHTQAFLKRTFPRMDLMRVGGAHDGGIDLTGWWWSPLRGLLLNETGTETDDNGPGRVRITVQCKSEARKLGPVHVREMQGTMTARHGQATTASVGQPDPAQPTNLSAVPAMAVLASSSGFSKQCLLQALAAPFPLMLVHLLFPEQQARAGIEHTPFACPTIAANDALLKGLLRSHLEVRWLATTVTPARRGPGRPAAPVKVDMPALYLAGKRL